MKADAARISALEEARRGDIARMTVLEEAHQVEKHHVSELASLANGCKAAQVELQRSKPNFADVKALLSESRGEMDSHTEQLKSAEFTRLAFASVIEALCVRFVPNHEAAMELIKGGSMEGDTAFNSFTCTWQPPKDTAAMPRAASPDRPSDPPSAAVRGVDREWDWGNPQIASIGSGGATARRRIGRSEVPRTPRNAWAPTDRKCRTWYAQRDPCRPRERAPRPPVNT